MPDRPPRRWVKRALIAVLASGVLVAAGNAVVLRSTRGGMVSGPESAPTRPFVIVLGNLVLPSGHPSRELRERLDTAYDLYHASRATRILVSGRTREGYDEPRAMAAWLEGRGVPSTDIVQDGGGHRTAATMAGAAGMGIRAALISTQAYHLPRALYLAQHAGIDAIGVAARRSQPSLLRGGITFLRETLARAETVAEVALRGVRR